MKRGPLLILSGPSGSGKSTVIRRLLAAGDLPLHLSVSATTRRHRPGEKDGIDYFFWTKEQFEEAIQAKAFLEWAQVHGSAYYGTLRQEVEPFRNQGVGVILDIDVQGADQVRQACPDHVSVFLQAPSMDTYEKRLRNRGTEDEASLQRRLANAREELARAGEFQYQIMNDDLAAAVSQLHNILEESFKRGQNA